MVTDVLEHPVSPIFKGQAVLSIQDLMPGKLPQAAMLMRCVQEMSVLDLGSETDYLEPRFTWFL